MADGFEGADRAQDFEMAALAIPTEQPARQHACLESPLGHSVDMANSDAAQPTSTTLAALFGAGFKTSLATWNNAVSGFDSYIVTALNSLSDQSKVPQARQALTELRTKLWDLRSEISRVYDTTTNVGEILNLRKAEAEYKTAIVNAWPNDLVAERVAYLGTGILAAGGAAYALSGYPSVSYTLLPTLVLWGVGLGLLLFGISRLVENQRDRFAFFRRQFKLEIEGKV